MTYKVKGGIKFILQQNCLNIITIMFSIIVPGRFEMKQPNYLLGHFEKFLGFETAWPVQNLVVKMAKSITWPF